MKLRPARLLGLFPIIFTLCLIVASCQSFDGLETTAPSDGDTISPPVETTKGNMDIQDHDHIYELRVVVPPSCGIEGRQAYVCVICGKQQYPTSVEALPHNYNRSDTLSTWPTCTTAGASVYRCSTCGYTQAEVLEAIGHRWRTKITCDSNTNEIIITPYCSVCQFVSANGYRYKIDDVEKLIDVDGQFAEYGGHSSSGGIIIKYYQRAPYYRVFCSDTYLLIVRNTESFMLYDGFWASSGAVGFYTRLGCTIVYEATISITADGSIKIIQ